MSRRISLLLLVVVMAASACSDESAGPTTTQETTTTSTTVAETTTTTVEEAGFPVTVAAANGEVTIERRPEAVVSLSPTATEMLFAVGAGDQVIAVDDQSDFPAEVPTTDLSGLTPNVEAIASYEPDLVVIGFDPGDLAASLQAVGIPVLLLPAAVQFDDAYAQIEQLGTATGNAAAATEVVSSMQSRIAEIVASVEPADPPLTYYHELDPSLFTATSETFIGRIYGLFGMENVADPADEDGFGYPQLNAEYLIDQDPDLVFLADTVCCGQTAETVSERPGWSELTAVRTGAVVEIDDSVASRWGPRVVDFVEAVAGAVSAIQASTP